MHQLASFLWRTYIWSLMKLLVVEDKPLVVRAAEIAGERLRMSVDCASDGWDAIARLEAERYDAILIDADLPHRSGFGVLAFLHEEHGRELPHVLLLSSDTGSVRRHLAEGTVRVMRTTESAEELEQALQSSAAWQS